VTATRRDVMRQLTLDALPEGDEALAFAEARMTRLLPRWIERLLAPPLPAWRRLGICIGREHVVFQEMQWIFNARAKLPEVLAYSELELLSTGRSRFGWTSWVLRFRRKTVVRIDFSMSDDAAAELLVSKVGNQSQE
jgi:hypothetical protein